MKQQGRKPLLLALVIGVLSLFLFVFLLQVVWAHRNWVQPSAVDKRSIADVLQDETMQEEEYSFLLAQTGLGKEAIDSLLAKGDEGKERILEYQTEYLKQVYVKCAPLLGWFTREDLLVDQERNLVKGPDFVNIQPGDMLLSLSTHSMGWMHGHAALVLDEKRALQTLALGENSVITDVDSWRNYSNYALLRVRGVSPERGLDVATYAEQHLQDIPYRLLAGLFQEKKMNSESKFFGAHCAYLVWYAWEEFGVDLDGDGGRVVTPRDLLESDQLEIVQVYGLLPHDLERAD